MNEPYRDHDGNVVDAIPETCPVCGERVTFGFGLMGGGYGPYALCLNESDSGCPWFAKQRLPADSEDGP